MFFYLIPLLLLSALLSGMIMGLIIPDFRRGSRRINNHHPACAVAFQLTAVPVQLALTLIKFAATIFQLSPLIVILPLAIGVLLTAALIAPIIIILIIGTVAVGLISVINGLLNIADRIVNNISAPAGWRRKERRKAK